jgi:hypothetical protein
MSPSDARHALQTRAHLSPQHPTYRSWKDLQRSHQGVSESVFRSSSVVDSSPWRSSRCFHSCRAAFDPLLAHPSRVSHKLPVQALFPCDLAVFWPSYRSLTTARSVGDLTAHPSVPRPIRPCGSFRRLPELCLEYIGSRLFQICFEPRQWPESCSPIGDEPDRAVTARPSVLRRIRPRSCLHRSLFIKLWV